METVLHCMEGGKEMLEVTDGMFYKLRQNCGYILMNLLLPGFWATLEHAVI